ncbi:beta-1,3-galactosyltransferase 5 [Anabrus simplex]|uniref:beta-1,3-galactosyltransferase 5 n=1 Tax=Anabrus simplex TaxID=316456 RepID=UPI0034DD0AF4
MLEKRRHVSAVYSTSSLVVLLCACLLFLSVYQLTSCPSPDVRLLPPSYLLILPGNASLLPPPYPLNTLPPDDRTRLINLQNFDFLINNFPCNDSNSSSLLLLVLVHSAPGNVDKRRTIRETWGQNTGDMYRILFLLGDVQSQESRMRLEEENRVHRDLVQGNFIDSYRNMTYKHVMALKWTAYFCPGARYLLKTDDDVFVNSPALLEFLAQDLSQWGARRLILCHYFLFADVRRSWRSKWRVSPREYPGRLYPPYCAGWAVLYSPDVVFLLYREAQRVDYFWIDDVHVTGTLVARANLSHTPLGSLALERWQVNALIDSDDPAVVSSIGVFLFGAPDLPQESIYRLWEVVQRRRRSS